MMDTPADIGDRLHELGRRRTGAERLTMACEMFDLARALTIAENTARHPGMSAVKLRVALLDRLYGEELTAADLFAVADA